MKFNLSKQIMYHSKYGEKSPPKRQLKVSGDWNPGITS
jgi:hypothetical protein